MKNTAFKLLTVCNLCR